MWGTFEKVPHAPSKLLPPWILRPLKWENHSYSIGGALRFGKSVYAVQTLHDFSLLYADSRLAPAIILGPTTQNDHESYFAWGSFVGSFV